MNPQPRQGALHPQQDAIPQAAGTVSEDKKNHRQTGGPPNVYRTFVCMVLCCPEPASIKPTQRHSVRKEQVQQDGPTESWQEKHPWHPSGGMNHGSDNSSA